MLLRYCSIYLASLFLAKVAIAESYLDANSCKGHISLSSGKKTLFHRSFSLGKSNHEITRVVIVLHGMNRNADDYFEYAGEAIASAGELNSYMQNSLPRIRGNLFARQMYFLAGSLDTGTNNLDLREKAMLQGQNRWKMYQANSQRFPGREQSSFGVVNDVGHSGRKMFASDNLRTAIFNN